MTIDQLRDVLLANFREQVRKYDKVSTSTLLNSAITVEVYNDRYVVSFDLPSYWEYVENGRKKGTWPNVKAIEEWIRVRPVVPSARNGKVPSTKQLAYLISRKIYNEGIQPAPILANTLQVSEDAIEQFVDEIIDVLIKKVEDKIFEGI